MFEFSFFVFKTAGIFKNTKFKRPIYVIYLSIKAKCLSKHLISTLIFYNITQWPCFSTVHRVFYEKIEMPDSNPWQISIISSYRDTTKPLDLYANGSNTYDLNHDWLYLFLIRFFAKLTDNIQYMLKYFFKKIYSMWKV